MAYEKIQKNIVDCLQRLDNKYCGVLECSYEIETCGNEDFSKGMDARKFKKIQKMLGMYVTYLKYYYRNRKNINVIFNDELSPRKAKKKIHVKVFEELFFNPFQSANTIAEKFKIPNPTTVRTIMNRCKTRLQSNKIMVPLVNNLYGILFAELKETRMKKNLDISYLKIVNKAVKSLKWILPKKDPPEWDPMEKLRMGLQKKFFPLRAKHMHIFDIN